MNRLKSLDSERWANRYFAAPGNFYFHLILNWMIAVSPSVRVDSSTLWTDVDWICCPFFQFLLQYCNLQYVWDGENCICAKDSFVFKQPRGMAANSRSIGDAQITIVAKAWQRIWTGEYCMSTDPSDRKFWSWTSRCGWQNFKCTEPQDLRRPLAAIPRAVTIDCRLLRNSSNLPNNHFRSLNTHPSFPHNHSFHLWNCKSEMMSSRVFTLRWGILGIILPRCLETNFIATGWIASEFSNVRSLLDKFCIGERAVLIIRIFFSIQLQEMCMMYAM